MLLALWVQNAWVNQTHFPYLGDIQENKLFFLSYSTNFVYIRFDHLKKKVLFATFLNFSQKLKHKIPVFHQTLLKRGVGIFFSHPR